MRRLLLLIVVVALFGCGKEQLNGVKGITPQGIAFKGAMVQTRVSAAEGTNGLTFSWDGTSDKIGLYTSDEAGISATNRKFTATAAGDATGFVPETPDDAVFWGQGLHDFYAYYPYHASAGNDITKVPVCVPQSQTQTADPLAHIGPLNLMYSARTDVSENNGEVQLSFSHALSVLNVKLTSSAEATISALKFTCKDENEALAFDGSIDLSTGAVTVGQTKSNVITLTFEEPAVIGAEETFDAYMLISPGHAGKEFEIAAAVDGEDIVLTTLTAPGDGLPVGRKIVARAEIPAAGYRTVLDFALVPNSDNSGIANCVQDIPAMGTTNAHPGTNRVSFTSDGTASGNELFNITRYEPKTGGSGTFGFSWQKVNLRMLMGRGGTWSSTDSYAVFEIKASEAVWGDVRASIPLSFAGSTIRDRKLQMEINGVWTDAFEGGTSPSDESGVRFINLEGRFFIPEENAVQSGEYIKLKLSSTGPNHNTFLPTPNDTGDPTTTVTDSRITLKFNTDYVPAP